MTNVLVTGGLGHIGSQLIRELSGTQDLSMVRILDNFFTQRYCSLFNLPSNIEYELVEGDIREDGDLDRALDGIDVVFHLAAITDAPGTLAIPELTEEVNAKATRKLVQACLKHSVRKIIYPSTTSVYGPSEGIVTEETTPNPQTPYAKYKLVGEHEIIGPAKAGDIEGFVLRFGTICGTSIGMRFHTAVNRFVFQACTGQPLTVWKDAYDQKRPYLTLSDGLDAFIFMMKSKKGSGEVYNILTQNASVREIVDLIRPHVADLTVKVTEAPILNQTSYVVSDDKAKRLGVVTGDSLKEAVGDTVSFLQSFLKVKNPHESQPVRSTC